MPFIKDAKTGLPSYIMPDFVEEEPQKEPEKESRLWDQPYDASLHGPRAYYDRVRAELAQDRSPDPSIYGEPGVTGAEVKEAFDKVVNAPGMMTQAEEEQYARARALATAVEYSGYETPEAAVRRASIYAKYIKDGTVPPADGLPPPETPPNPPSE